MTTAKPHTLSYSLFLLKATVKTVLSVTAMQHTRAYLKAPNIPAVCEGNELQTGKKISAAFAHSQSLQGLFGKSAAISLVIISTQCTRCQVPSIAQDVLDGWDLHTILCISYLNPGSGNEMGQRERDCLCACDLWKSEGTVGEWPEGWAGTCPGEQPGQAVAKPHHVPAPVAPPINTGSAGQDTWVRMLPSWDQTHATSPFREFPGF